MTTDPSIYFYASGLIGIFIGWFGKHLVTARIVRRAQADAYQQARLFFERKAEPNVRRI